MTEATETPETPTESAPVPSPDAVEATETPETPQDPNILGKMTPEENAKVLEYKQHAQNLTAEVGRMSVRISRMEAQVEEARQQRQQAITQYDAVESEANKLLDDIGKRFGIKPGEPWQTLPDGTIRRIDPALLQQAQEAQKAAAAAAAQGAAAPPTQ